MKIHYSTLNLVMAFPFRLKYKCIMKQSLEVCFKLTICVKTIIFSMLEHNYEFIIN